MSALCLAGAGWEVERTLQPAMPRMRAFVLRALSKRLLRETLQEV